jgi:hypothetical protein
MSSAAAFCQLQVEDFLMEDGTEVTFSSENKGPWGNEAQNQGNLSFGPASANIQHDWGVHDQQIQKY